MWVCVSERGRQKGRTREGVRRREDGLEIDEFVVLKNVLVFSTSALFYVVRISMSCTGF